MKKLLLLAALLHSICLSAQTSAPWIKPVSFFGMEEIRAMGYVPGNAVAGASIWTFAHGGISAGPDTEFHEYRFSGRNAASGTIVFDYQVKGVLINKVTYDASRDQVMVLINIEELSADLPVIGPNALTPPVLGPDCFVMGLLRYNRSGVLLATEWLPFPCTHPAADAPCWDIDTLQEKVVLSMALYGDLNTDSTEITFGSTTKILRTDSTYLSVFQWDYAGNPLQMAMFEQPVDRALRSRIVDVRYGDNGDICLLGTLVSDIHFDNITLTGVPGRHSSFAARLKADGTVAAAKRIFSGDSAGFPEPLGLAFNRVNRHFYFLHSWTDQLVIDGNVVAHGNKGVFANMMIAALDSNLVQQHHVAVRYGDTLGTKDGLFPAFKCLDADPAGNLLLGILVTDSFRVAQKLFRSSVSNSQTDIAVIRCDKDLKPDTCIRSVGTGFEHITTLTAGPLDEVYIGGWFYDQMAFPPLEANVPAPDQDAFVVKLSLKNSPATGIRPAAAAAGYALYPNPASDKLYIEMEQVKLIALYTIDGKLLRTMTAHNGAKVQAIGVSDLPPGVYVVRLIGQGGAMHSASFTKK